MKRKKVSIDDVAKRAKVSITTVSRVINNVPTVSPKNREKVEEVIADLKFKPNVSAQRLAKGTNNTIGLVMPGYPGIFYSFYAVEIIRGVGHACESQKLDMVFHITNGDNPINSGNVGGIIFADIIENRQQIEAALAAGIPSMVINNRVKDLDVSFIAVDNKEGGRLVADYFLSLGHKRIATITGNLNTQAGAERQDGFKGFLDKNNNPLFPEYIYEGDYSRRCARIAAEQFLEMKESPTAIFAASDDMALEVISYLLEKGVRVPEDVSVIGFDDNPACLYGSVGLTTIKQPLFDMGEHAVKGLVNLMNGQSESNVEEILTPELVIRESCSSIKS